MKIFAFILSIYITSLSFVPCSDASSHCSTNTNIEQVSNEQASNHSDHKDNCSPFCVCDCCGTLITMPDILPFFDTGIVCSTTYLSFYTCNYSFDYDQGIWHPPSIA